MKNKKLIIVVGIILVVSLVVMIITIINKPKEEDFKIEGIDKPVNEEVLRDYVLDNLKISNVSILTTDGISVYKARVYNTSDKDVNINTLTMIVYEGKEETKIDILKNTKIVASEFTYVNVTSLKNLSNVTKIEYIFE